ncbi:hypothetical protein ACMXZD_07650, partial [Pasteurella multocida]
MTASSHEDSRKPSDALIQIQQKIPNVFDKNHYLNVQTSDKLAKNIRDFMDREYLSDLALSLTLKINN